MVRIDAQWCQWTYWSHFWTYAPIEPIDPLFEPMNLLNQLVLFLNLWAYWPTDPLFFWTCEPIEPIFESMNLLDLSVLFLNLWTYWSYGFSLWTYEPIKPTDTLLNLWTYWSSFWTYWTYWTYWSSFDPMNRLNLLIRFLNLWTGDPMFWNPNSGAAGRPGQKPLEANEDRRRPGQESVQTSSVFFCYGTLLHK